MSIIEKFGENLRKLRAAKGLSQEEIAFASKLSVYYVSKLERGKANPSLETMTKLAKALKTSLSEIVKGI
jgi:transcriptional regulator with XRE-family HTH domain